MHLQELENKLAQSNLSQTFILRVYKSIFERVKYSQAPTGQIISGKQSWVFWANEQKKSWKWISHLLSSAQFLIGTFCDIPISFDLPSLFIYSLLNNFHFGIHLKLIQTKKNNVHIFLTMAWHHEMYLFTNVMFMKSIINPRIIAFDIRF